jgi:hypothetical protein
VAREFGKTARHPIRTYENLISGASEKRAEAASKQVNAIYGSYLTRLEAPGRSRLGEGATALARLRESGVSSEQLLPQLVAELTPKLTRGGVLAGEGAGFTPEQIQAAAENLIENRGYLPEIWSPDVDWSSQGTRQAEAAFIRSVLESDPTAHLLSPVTTPGFENIDMMLPQVAALAKRTKGGDSYPVAAILERNTNRYVRNNFEALVDGLNNGVDPSLLQVFAAGQKEANFQALAGLLDSHLSRNTRALERVMTGADPRMTPEKMSEIILDSFNTWKGQARDVEKMGWRSLNLNGELMLPKTLSTLDDLTVSGILGGRLEPGALTEIRANLQLAGGVIGGELPRLNSLKNTWRTKLADIKDTPTYKKKGLTLQNLETLLAGIRGSLKARGLQRLFPLNDAIPLIFRPDDVGQMVNLAENYQFLTAQLPGGVLTPLKKGPKETPADFAVRKQERAELIAGLDFPEGLSLPDFPTSLLANKDALVNTLVPSDSTSVQLTNRFRTSAPIGEKEAGSIPEAVGYGTALDLRSTMLSRLREPNVPPSERRLLTELQSAVLEDLKAAGLATGNTQLTLLTSYSEALNELIIRGLAGQSENSVKNTDEALLMEALTRGSGTKVGQSFQSVINAGRFLEENTEELLSIAAASDDPEVNKMVAYLDETLPQNKQDLNTLQTSLESFLRNMVVTGVIKEVPISSRMPGDVNALLPERVSETEFFVDPGALARFDNKYGNLSESLPVLSTFFDDLRNAASENNLIQALKNNRGMRRNLLRY